MRKQTVGILLGVTASALLLSGCGAKQTATRAAEESEETEKEGTGEDPQTEAAIKEAEEASEEADADKSNTSEEEPEDESAPIARIGILLPDDASRENAQDGVLFSEAMTEKNIKADIRFAKSDAEIQAGQIMELLSEEPDALLVDPVDSYALTEVLAKAKEQGVLVMSYEDLVMNSDAVTYYATYDMRKIGQRIGDTIADKMDLKKLQAEGGFRTIEFFMGSTDDLGALFLYNGVLERLSPYLEDGTLTCPSGQVSFAETGIRDFSTEAALARYQSILENDYPDGEQPDIICTGFDGACYGILDTLEESGIYSGDEAWPYINGVGCEAKAVQAIAEDRIAFSIYMDRKKLVDITADMLETLVTGDKPDVNNYEQYDNGRRLIRTNTVDAEIIDAYNYEILIDNGYYRETEVAPRFTPTPYPTATPTPTPTPEPTATPTPTPTPEPTATPTPTPTPEPTATTTPTPKFEKEK